MAALYEKFQQYDINQRGSLSQYEVAEMMKGLGYKTDPDYIGGLMQMFAVFDTNGDGVIGFDEFKLLWEFFDGDAKAAADVATYAEHPLLPTFQKYDINRNGVLSQHEVSKMIQSLGFKAETSYVEATMEEFGSFDTNNNHVIDFSEFQALWEHFLGGDEDAEDAGDAEDAEHVDDAEDGEDAEDAEASTIAAKFYEYDTNGDGRIDFDETKAMMEKLGYRVSDEYVDGLMDIFGTFGDQSNYPHG